MANEFTINGSISFQSSELSDPIVAQVVDLIASITSGGKHFSGVMSVGITEEAIPLGEVSSPGWFFAKNLDPTNFINIRVGTGGSSFVKLRPTSGGNCHFCLLPLGVNVTAPFAIADTAACRMQYWIWDN